MNIETELMILIRIFPNHITKILENHLKKNNLIEIILDLGRRPEVRFSSGTQYISLRLTSWQDIDYITKRIGKFSDDNRAGIERTLHRVSCIRNRQGIIVGLTCRVGRSIVGTINIIRDLLELNKSLLILGKPGTGKTTTIREISRVLSDEMEKRVVIIDSSNEIGGNSDTLHPGIGKARRMQVPYLRTQHDLMIEAVENHMPEVIIVDEIGTELEASAAKTIAERGVQLIGTVHGNSLENLIKNPTLVDLIGGIESVTLSDEEAKRRKTKKSILERKTLPAFQIAIEINQKTCWIVHQELTEAIDTLLLSGKQSNSQIRLIKYTGLDKTWRIHTSNLFQDLSTFTFFSKKKVYLHRKKSQELKKNQLASIKKITNREIYICAYLISKVKIKKVSKILNLRIKLTKKMKNADLLLTLNSFLEKNAQLKNLQKENNLLIYGLEKSSIKHIRQSLYTIYNSKF